jgi:hypothetical protein
MKITHAVLALVTLSPFSGATTWIVDVTNGPGTNFTQISTAIAGVSEGDTLIVRPGLYQPFLLDKSLSIIGLGGSVGNQVQFTSATIENLPAGSTTVMANLFQVGSNPTGVQVLNNSGALMVDGLTSNALLIVASSNDVRFRRLHAYAGVRCDGSRVEIADYSSIYQVGAPSCCCDWPDSSPGAPALQVNGGEVHVARSSAAGGHGGDSYCPGMNDLCSGNGGGGGPGIDLEPNARLLVSGIFGEGGAYGGQGGHAYCTHGVDGGFGYGLVMVAGCEARVSGETISTLNSGGTITHPSPDDPTIVGVGTPTQGSNFTMSVHGPVGATADVILGRRPIIVGTPQLDEEQLTPVNRVFHLGVIPASGTVSLNFPVSSAWPQGFSVVFQGRLDVGGSTVYTNSLPMIVQ